MITRSSALLTATASDHELSEQRARVLIDLLRSKMSIDDIAMALNCSEFVVRTLLVAPYRSAYTGPGMTVHHPIDLMSFPPSRSIASERPDPEPEEAARRQERLTDRLYKETCIWLVSFEASDGGRQNAVEQAGFFLDKSAVYRAGKYLYAADRVSAEIRYAWEPWIPDRYFPIVAGRFLACWIRFWITDPEIWDRALDLAWEHFGRKVQAAA